jgi:NTE family protein
MKRALVLSGGGSHGAYQVGVLKVLISNRNKNYDTVAGVSVGAINAMCLAMYPPSEQKQAVEVLEKLWGTTIRGNSSIYKPWYFYGANYLAFFWKGSLNHTAPLRSILESNFNPDKLRASGVELKVGAVSLTTGKYTSASSNTYPAEQMVDWVMASAAMPIIFEPITVDGEVWVDGGVRNVTPISDVIKNNPDITEVDVVLADSLTPVKHTQDNYKNGITVAARTVSLMVDEIIRTDLEYCSEVAPHVTVNVYAPNSPLTYEAFSFKPKDLADAIELGRIETLAKTM